MNIKNFKDDRISDSSKSVPGKAKFEINTSKNKNIKASMSNHTSSYSLGSKNNNKKN